MQLTPDLAARMPHALQELGNAAHLPFGFPAGMSVPACSPGDPDMSPVNMDLSGNSMFGRQQGVAFSLDPTLPLLPDPPPTSASWPPAPMGQDSPAHYAFTQNITGAVPALSTLLEEDEESHGVPGGSSPGSHNFGAAPGGCDGLQGGYENVGGDCEMWDCGMWDCRVKSHG